MLYFAVYFDTNLVEDLVHNGVTLRLVVAAFEYTVQCVVDFEIILIHQNIVCLTCLFGFFLFCFAFEIVNNDFLATATYSSRRSCSFSCSASRIHSLSWPSFADRLVCSFWPCSSNTLFEDKISN